MNAIRPARLIQLGLATTASLLLFSLAGCTWVPLTPSGESVQFMPSSSDLRGCERVGAVTAQTKSRVGFIARNEDTILEELQTLARNDAAEMGANRVVAEGPPSTEGRQRFAAYRCPSASSTRATSGGAE